MKITFSISHSVLVFLVILFSEASSQSIIDRLTFQSTLDKKTVPAPANFQANFPSNRENSFSVDIALRINAVPNKFLKDKELGPFIEYHRNTEIEKEQSVFKIGVSYDFNFGDLAVRESVPVLLGKINYMKDWQDSLQSLQANAMFTTLFRQKGLNPYFFWIPNISSRFGVVEFIYEPDVGIEFQYTQKSTARTANGTVIRFVGQIKSVLYPFALQLKKRLSIPIGYTYRHIIVDNENLEEDEYQLFQAGVEVILFEGSNSKHKAGIALTYTYGEDPANGFKKQEVTRLTLTMKL